jgi:hypothetical protein
VIEQDRAEGNQGGGRLVAWQSLGTIRINDATKVIERLARANPLITSGLETYLVATIRSWKMYTGRIARDPSGDG